MSISEKVKATNRRYALVSPGARILVAVSGGPDSVALLHILYDLREELGLDLEVAHLQHGIRGEEAREDARFAALVAAKLKLPIHLKEINLPQMKIEAGKGNLEALARAARYRFFAEVARRNNIDKIATAHTQDDQAETVIMWFLRGCGLKGLGGMAPMHQLVSAPPDSASEVTVIRPLLDISKTEILEYLKERQLTYRVDRSNQDPTFLRNWIRQQLMAKIRERIDTRLPARLSQQAELIRDEDAYLEDVARAELGKLRSSGGMNRALFLRQAKVMQRRVLRLWIEETRGHLRGIDFAHVDELLKLIAAPVPQSRLAIPGGWELVKEYDTLRLEQSARSRKRLCYSYEFFIGTALRIPEAAMMLLSERISPALFRLPGDLMEAAFDLAALPESLTVRNFRHGDRFQPLGMSGHKKVKELFIENKVPLSVRRKLPLLALGDEILWIAGYGRSEIGRVSPQTTWILQFKMVPLKG